MIRLAGLIISFFIGSLYNSSAQQVNLNEIYNEVEGKHSIDLDTVNVCKLVVWNGIPYSPDSIENELRGVKLSDFQFTSLGKFDNEGSPHMNCDYLIILGSGYKLKRKERKILIDSVINQLDKNLPNNLIQDNPCPECLQVLINDKICEPYEALEYLKDISRNQINYIQFYLKPDPAYYGENAKNGLVDIRIE